MAAIHSKGLATCIYRVPEIESAKRWYSEAFGVAPYFDQPFYVGFNIAGYELGLQPEGTAPVPVHNVMTYWRVDDVTATMDALMAQGASLLDAPQDVGEGIVCGAVRDPWGNAIGLIFNPHFAV